MITMKNLLIKAIVVIAMVSTAAAQSPEPQPHRFLDRTNRIGLLASAAMITTDSISTQSFMNCCTKPILNHQTNMMTSIAEGNPIARPFVGSRKGQVFISSTGLFTETALMLFLHRHNHHLMEHMTPFVLTGIETYYTLDNYRQIHQYKQIK